MSIRVHSIETFGTNDGPGIRLVIFLQGCFFRCLYCQNPDTQSFEGGTLYSPAQLVALAEKQRPYFGATGGVTLSGGEPLAQAKELLPFMRLAHKRGLHLALDTNGGIDSDHAKKLFDVSDLVLLDIKHIDDEGHKKLTGASNTKPLAMAAWREASGKPMRLRYVLVPGYNDDEATVRRFGETFGAYTTIERVELLPYHTLGAHKYAALGRPYPLKGLKPPSPASVARVRETLLEFFANVSVQ